ncbi:hypothetical protein CCM_06507 [Cordyceps militaris CM01]|uniref:Uncharacterized protein n=1 Tax=Cordyceps militaris (strain CM01) TaxID=983644 RepID=G3JMQ1_CORMM|nr:uncharacterized protein CCM_06507 [Cordyceps militaris CM01]EGX90087.1 hypothetical protein CCM_06507 [Cordyceps militaris CM01]
MGLIGGAIKLIIIPILFVVAIAVLGGIYIKHRRSKRTIQDVDQAPFPPPPPVSVAPPPPPPPPVYAPSPLQYQPLLYVILQATHIQRRLGIILYKIVLVSIVKPSPIGLFAILGIKFVEAWKVAFIVDLPLDSSVLESDSSVTQIIPDDVALMIPIASGLESSQEPVDDRAELTTSIRTSLNRLLAPDISLSISAEADLATFAMEYYHYFKPGQFMATEKAVGITLGIIGITALGLGACYLSKRRSMSKTKPPADA